MSLRERERGRGGGREGGGEVEGERERDRERGISYICDKKQLKMFQVVTVFRAHTHR